MRIMVITAHPHSFALYCGGTIPKHSCRGDEVFVMSLSSGEAMTDRVSRAGLARINIRERIDAIDEGAVQPKVSAVVGPNRRWGLQSGVMYADPFRESGSRSGTSRPWRTCQTSRGLKMTTR